MSLERFKTQVLLLHSEQHTLDNLSSGFNDRYTVHCATSGSEALNTLGETQIDVIVSAQRLPGMSGLEALREAKKRSPDTIGILLAGNEDDGLEALVGDQEVFQVVRGSITPDALTSLIDNATQQARLLALAESANDVSANPDEPVGEHIVMETSENGSAIISDGTGRLPALNPKKVSTAADVGTRSVDVLVLTQDQEFLATVKESARGMHHVVYANTLKQADEAVRKQKVGVAVIDAAMVGADVETLTLHLRSVAPRLVAIVAGRRDDGEMLMDLINRGKVYRFLLKPVSPGRSRLAIEASVRHHLEAPDAAFARAGKPTPAPRLFETAAPTPLKPATKPVAKPAPKAVAKPAPKPAPKPAAKPAAKAAPKPAPAPEATPKPAAAKQPAPAPARKAAEAAPQAIVAKREDALSPIDDGLGNAFDDDSSFTETVTGLVKSVGRSFSPQRNAVAESGADLSKDGAGGSVFGGPKLFGIAAIAIVAIAGGAYWMLGGSEQRPVVREAEPAVAAPQPSTTETTPAPFDKPSIDNGPDLDTLLADARQALQDGRIVQPGGDNAIELYLSARESIPDDATLESELAGAVDQALGLAENALLERRAADAEVALDRVALADPENSRLPFLEAQLTDMQVRGHLDDALAAIRESRFEDARVAIDAARSLPVVDTSAVDVVADELAAALSQQRTDEVLARANARLDEGQLIAPSNDNARYYYELALSNDPDNAAARQGLETVAGKLILRARTEIDANRFDTAANLIADARRLDPQSTEVAAADGALQAARDRQERERQDAARRAAEQRAAAEQAAAQRAAEERAAAERAAAEKAAAERLSIEQLAQTPTDDARAAAPAPRTAAVRQPAAGSVQQPAAAGPQTAASETVGEPGPGTTGQSAGETAQPPVAEAAQADPAFSRTFAGREPQLPAAGGVAPKPAEQEPVSATSLKRTKYVAPKYPRNAMRRDITGWVDVVFTVDIDGSISDVAVRESYPDDSFDAAATRAVEQWEYEPVIEDGVAIQKRAAVRMSFELQ